jgi:catechol 2,3-dioxygenase-like lactoylglutathione lyase family enzyme
MTAPSLPSVGHVALSVTDLERATRFYTEVLGLEQVPRPAMTSSGAWLAAGNALIHLGVVAEVPARDPLAHFALTVPAAQIQPLTELVKAHGGDVVRDLVVRDEFGAAVTSAICRDSEGNLFELTDAPGGAPSTGVDH